MRSSNTNDVSSQDGVTTEIVLALSDVTGEDPLEMTPPLATVINPTALENLVQDSSSDLRITFEYQGYEIDVQGDSTIKIRNPTNRG